MKIKTIIFDNNGVFAIGKYSLIKRARHQSIGIHKYAAKKFKIPLDSWFDAIDTPYAKSIEGKLTKSQVLKQIASNLQTTPEKLEKILLKAYKKHFKENKKLFKIAFNLKKQGYKIALLSDQWPVSKQALVSEKIKKFNKVIISCDVGMRKPNPKMYKLALKKLNAKPQETIFIDDRIWNIKPAKKLGFRTIQFKNNKQLIKELTKYGVKLK